MQSLARSHAPETRTGALELGGDAATTSHPQLPPVLTCQRAGAAKVSLYFDRVGGRG